MKPLPLFFASLILSAPALARNTGDNDARPDDKIVRYCENLETGDRIEFLNESVELCPAGYSGFRNVTDAYVTDVDDAPLSMPLRPREPSKEVTTE